jgi:hypothetical protein
MQAAVCLLVDLVGSYKVSPEMKKRATELRARLEQEALKKVRVRAGSFIFKGKSLLTRCAPSYW